MRGLHDVAGILVVRGVGLAAGLLALMISSAVAQTTPVGEQQFATMARRLFPELSSIKTDDVKKAIAPVFLARARRIDACGEAALCRIKAALWTDVERTELVDAVCTETPLPFRVSDDGVGAQLSREILGINSILRTYGLGEAPRYPEIDGPDNRDDKRAVQALALSRVLTDDPIIGFDPSVSLSLALLDTNNRIDAIAFEPITAGLNAAAFQRALNLHWSNYRFTALIVLGAGPDDLATPISVRSEIRVQSAARLFASGEAPLLIVSGGAVHPRGTTHVEALEMRHALIERYGIPANAILIDPYARHTTTNLRNAARLLKLIHAPADQDALIVSDAEHISYIQSHNFADRNVRELGYAPGAIRQPISSNAIPFHPSAAASRIDPSDPLDP